ncbi:thermonuclease family protein [Maridesulfovibrio sp. FT414]|uniref:thermonuclease family protein n=1 Tax=Maridesulfovibrio sp. FT414 TaxID=2979469 RepID=UPI003D80A30B
MKSVIDGDTFVLEDNRNVRIASIDTPEIGHNGDTDQYYARKSKSALTELVKGKKVRVELTSDGKDKYGRLVAWVYVRNIFVNEFMVRNGFAVYYHHRNNRENYQNILLQAQRKAYKDEKGFWPVIRKQKMFTKEWVGNRNSRRCFPEGNSLVQRISLKNRVNFTDLGEAYRQGYSPARNIGFWPQER